MFLAPILILTYEPGVGPVLSNTSVRVITFFTGSPVFFDNKAAIGSTYTGILPPNPPPISIGVTLTCDTGRSKIAATVSRTVNAP